MYNSVRPYLIAFRGVTVKLESLTWDYQKQGLGAGNFFCGSVPAPAPDFFFKRLWLLIFSQAAPAPGIFFLAAPAPRGHRNRLRLHYWLSLAKYSFPRKLVR